MSFTFFGLFGAGLLTFLSPCVLPLIPVLLANFASSKAPVKATLWFITGFTLVFVAMGLSIPSLSQSLGAIKPYLLIGAGALLGLFGLKMMQALPTLPSLNWMTRSLHMKAPQDLHGLLFGAVFGLSWTPCVGPVLGSVLTYVAAQNSTPLQSALFLFTFALGIALPILAVSLGSKQLLPQLKRLRPYLPKIEYAIGLGLFIFGVYIANQGRLSQAIPVLSENSTVAALTTQNEWVPLNKESPLSARLLFFYSENCPICHAMESYLPEMSDTCSKENFALIRINVDRPENSQAAQTYHVKAVPTLSVLNDRGDEVIHLVGYQTQARLLDALRTTSRFACKTQVAPLGDLPSNLFPKSNSSCGKEKGSC